MILVNKNDEFFFTKFNFLKFKYKNIIIIFRCFESMPDQCDFGKFAEFLIPPNCVQLRQVRKIREKKNFTKNFGPFFLGWRPKRPSKLRYKPY